MRGRRRSMAAIADAVLTVLVTGARARRRPHGSAHGWRGRDRRAGRDGLSRDVDSRGDRPRDLTGVRLAVPDAVGHRDPHANPRPLGPRIAFVATAWCTADGRTTSWVLRPTARTSRASAAAVDRTSIPRGPRTARASRSRPTETANGTCG